MKSHMSVIACLFCVLYGTSQKIYPATKTSHCTHFTKETKSEKPNSKQASKPKEKNTLPKDFGKKHFIVGVASDELKKVAVNAAEDNTVNKTSTEPDQQAYFSPDNDIETLLCSLIDNEKHEIRIATFTLTNSRITKTLSAAKARGVKIEIVTDPICMQDKFNKIVTLHEHGIPVYIYKPTGSSGHSLSKMHHKFVIFGADKANDHCVFIGSFNLTKSACTNQESVLLSKNNPVFDQFCDQFSLLKERSVHCTNELAQVSPAYAIAHKPQKITQNTRRGKRRKECIDEAVIIA